jgi:hypothetical protein
MTLIDNQMLVVLDAVIHVIVVDATTNLDDEPSVRCRRRRGRRRCTGTVMSYPAADDSDRIHWYCPVCNDNGFISG